MRSYLCPRSKKSRCKLCRPEKEDKQSLSDSEDQVSDGCERAGPMGDDLYSPWIRKRAQTYGEHHQGQRGWVPTSHLGQVV